MKSEGVILESYLRQTDLNISKYYVILIRNVGGDTMAFNLFKKQPKVGGEIKYYNLTEWWLNELSQEERNIIRNMYKPLISTTLIDEGDISYSSASVVSFLGTLSCWFKDKENYPIGKKIYLKGEKYLTNNTNILDKHFFYLSGIRLFYSNRNNDPMALDKAVFCCQNQIAISNEAKREFLKEYNEDSLPSHTGYKQLAIIYEKEKHFADALKITEQALAEGWNTEDCISRIEKLKKKL